MTEQTRAAMRLPELSLRHAEDVIDDALPRDPAAAKPFEAPPPVDMTAPWSNGAPRASNDALDLILRSSRFTRAESSMLMLLLSNPRRPVARNELMRAAFEREWHPLSRAIDVHIVNLRRKIDGDPLKPSLIRTIRGVGYMYVPEIN